MRIRIAHRTEYRYDPPATGVIQVLRLTPRNHEGQYVVRWRIDVSADARLNAHEDAFGNLSHVFSADGPFSELSPGFEHRLLAGARTCRAQRSLHSGLPVITGEE